MPLPRPPLTHRNLPQRRREHHGCRQSFPLQGILLRKTTRSANNLSAEWLGHNIIAAVTLYQMDNIVNVTLDWDKDPREYINTITSIMEKLGLE